MTEKPAPSTLANELMNQPHLSIWKAVDRTAWNFIVSRVELPIWTASRPPGLAIKNETAEIIWH